MNHTITLNNVSSRICWNNNRQRISNGPKNVKFCMYQILKSHHFYASLVAVAAAAVVVFVVHVLTNIYWFGCSPWKRLFIRISLYQMGQMSELVNGFSQANDLNTMQQIHITR